jgi:hypothetical protein
LQTPCHHLAGIQTEATSICIYWHYKTHRVLTEPSLHLIVISFFVIKLGRKKNDILKWKKIITCMYINSHLM